MNEAKPERLSAALLPVTQAARDAAADYIGPLSGRQTDARLRSGKNDHVSIVQAFAKFERDILARHRQSSNAASVERVVEESQFLCDRLDELDWSMSYDDFGNSYNGHVDPSHSRLKGFLASLSTPTAEPTPTPDRIGKDAVREALEPFAAKITLIADHYDEDYCPDWSPFIPVSAYRNAARALTAPALSTPQRQEYDGEAVREALSTIVKGVETSERHFAARLESRKNRLSWHVVNVLQDALAACEGTARAALAHPAQATPSALSGDAGEVKRLRVAKNDAFLAGYEAGERGDGLDYALDKFDVEGPDHG